MNNSPLSINQTSSTNSSANMVVSPIVPQHCPSRTVPNRLEFAKRNNMYFFEVDEAMSDAVRYPLSVLGQTPVEQTNLRLFRVRRRQWWRVDCEYDEASYRFISPNPPIDINDPYWSQKVGFEVEPRFKTAFQWSRAQLKIRAESPAR